MLDAVARSLSELSVLAGSQNGRTSRVSTSKSTWGKAFRTDEDIASRPRAEIGTIHSRVGVLHLNVMGARWFILMRGGHSLGGGRCAASNLCVPRVFLDGQPVSLHDVRTFVRTPDIKGIEV